MNGYTLGAKGCLLRLFPLSDVRALLVGHHPPGTLDIGDALRGEGATVQTCTTNHDTLRMLVEDPVDVVLVHSRATHEQGVLLANEIRTLHPDVAVLLLVEKPTLESAIGAVAAGVSRYLVEPLSGAELREAVRCAVKTTRWRMLGPAAVGRQAGATAFSSAQLDRAIMGLYVAWQPIISAGDGRTLGFEALARSSEPEMNPGRLFELAEATGRLVELGRVLRSLVAADLPRLPADTLAFVNVHVDEVRDNTLVSGLDPLSDFAGSVVLELTERSSLERVPDAAERVHALRGLGYRIAIDDLGAGYAGLSALARFTPEFAKIDMSLVRGLQGDPLRRRLVRMLAVMCAEIGVPVVAEGIEHEDELAAVREAGCTHVQGHFLGRPGPLA